MSQVNSQIDLSIIILSYKSKDHLAVLLPSVFESQGVDFNNVVQAIGLPNPVAESQQAIGLHYAAEIIVVDNGSNDGTYEWLKELISTSANQHISLIANANTGFAHGNNLGIKQASGKYILLLNPDTKLEPNTLQTMLNFMEERQDVGIAGCKLVKADGKLDLACRRRFPNPKNSFQRLFLRDNTDYNYSNVGENLSMEVDSVVGAFLLIRKSVIEKIGFLDEKFFMYGEDLDWCWRCKEAGYKAWYYPKAKATHFKGESSRKTPFRALKWFHDSMWIFYQKHYSEKYPQIFNWIVWLGIYSRFLALAIINVFKKNPVVSR